MTDDITAVEEPKRSDEYLQLLEQLKDSFSTPVDIANRLFERGKKDGLSNDLIRKDIESVLAGVIKERRLREILPLELKRKYTISDLEENDSALSAESDASTAVNTITYNHSVEAFKTSLAANELGRKNEIIQMAQNLDKAGNIPKEKIASQILYELRDIVDKDSTFTSSFVLDSLPSEYKLPPKPEKKVYKYAPESEERKLTNVIINMVDVLSGMSCDSAEKMPPSQVVIECKNHMRRIVLPWSDDQLLITRNALRPLTPLVKRFQEMVDEEVQSRREKAKLLSR